MRQKWSDGSILRIALQSGVAHCQMIRHPFYAFFEEFSSVELDTVLARPILFRVAVTDTAFKTGRWQIVGKRAPLATVLEPMRFYRQDRFTKGLSIASESGYLTAASPEQCRGLECDAVWDPEHVEERLEDHLAGRPNKWVLSMAISESSQ